LGSSTEDDGAFGKSDVIVIILFVAIIVGVIIAAALITYLIKGKYRHDRQTMEIIKRKRQSMADDKNRKSNGQSVALTGV
jgi:phosphate/sulfate permease